MARRPDGALETEVLRVLWGAPEALSVSEIRELGRATQGVTLIALDDGSKLSGLQRIVENDAGTDGADDAPAAEADPA